MRLAHKVFVGSLLAVFVGIVLHAPLSVSLGALWPEYSLYIKAWKEVLLVVAAVAMVVILIKGKKFEILKHPAVLLVAVYAALHLLLLAVFWQGWQPSIAGLMIDLRYLLFFVLVFVAIKLYPGLRTVFLKAFVAGALIVLLFALMQVFVLPHDVLKYLGYSTETITAYLTVDKNYDFVRINSTLRGPNPLGAYAVIVLSLLAATMVVGKKVKRTRRDLALVAVLSAGGVVALWASYSRSALGAALVALGVVSLAVWGKRWSRKVWTVVGLGALVLVFAVFALRDSYLVSNVILHEDPVGGSAISSNEGHVDSLLDGSQRALGQPLGAGVGSTGSASLLGEDGIIIENQYLYIAHEVGWLGLGLFVAVFVAVLTRLWQRRQDWLALGVFASGVGMAVIGLVLPVWVDDTVSIIWWGLAAVCLAEAYNGTKRKKNDRLQKTN